MFWQYRIQTLRQEGGAFGICPRLFQGETLLCKGLTTSTLNIQCVEYDIKPILFKDETVIPRGLAYFPPVPSMPT